MKKAKLRSFFSSLTENDVKRMKNKGPQIHKLISKAIDDLLNTLNKDPILTFHYIVPSLNTSSGAVRPFNGKIVAYYGLELLSRFDEPGIKATIFHESFHVLHFQNLFPAFMEKYRGNMNIFAMVRGEGALFFSFIEGLAVYTTEIAYPNAFRPGLIEKNVPLYQQHFNEYTQEFLKDSEAFDYSKYEKYFLDYSQNPSVPAKFGYWLGYQVVKSLHNEYSISEMMRWTPPEMKDKVSSEIQILLNEMP
jgi:uncharacterized protein YjaZ